MFGLRLSEKHTFSSKEDKYDTTFTAQRRVKAENRSLFSLDSHKVKHIERLTKYRGQHTEQ